MSGWFVVDGFSGFLVLVMSWTELIGASDDLTGMAWASGDSA